MGNDDNNILHKSSVNIINLINWKIYYLEKYENLME